LAFVLIPRLGAYGVDGLIPKLGAYGVDGLISCLGLGISDLWFIMQSLLIVVIHFIDNINMREKMCIAGHERGS